LYESEVPVFKEMILDIAIACFVTAPAIGLIIGLMVETIGGAR